MKAPPCACGCGLPTKWLKQTRKPGETKRTAGWGTYLSGHNARCFKNGVGNLVEPDLSNPLWCYLLGAHMGDGCDSHRLDIAVGDDLGWATPLNLVMGHLGLWPHMTKTHRVRASCPLVMREFNRWKHGGRAGLWAFPDHLSHWLDVLAGLMDSDGGIPNGCFIVYQRNNGNIERLNSWLREQGETRLHVGLDRRSGFSMIKGVAVPIRDTARLGIRGTLRDELAPHLRNPVKSEAWAAYRAAHRRRQPAST